MTDIVAFITARLDADEHDALRGYLKAEPNPEYTGWDKSTTAGLPPLVAMRVLADIAAKRAILDRHTPRTYESFGPDGKDLLVTSCLECVDTPPCATLRHLATVYAQHPDFREEWKP